MEILRFDEPDAPAPKRKRPSKAWLALSLVAALMGVGTAFASSTIKLNTDNLASLGQGVATVTGCDSSINVIPGSGVDLTQETPTFDLNTISLSAIDMHSKRPDGTGCGDQALKIQVFQLVSAEKVPEDHPSPISCTDLISSLNSNLQLNHTTYSSGTPLDSAITIDSREAGDGSGCEIWVKLDSPSSEENGRFTINGLKFVGDENHAVSHIAVVSSQDYPF